MKMKETLNTLAELGFRRKKRHMQPEQYFIGRRIVTRN